MGRDTMILEYPNPIQTQSNRYSSDSIKKKYGRDLLCDEDLSNLHYYGSPAPSFPVASLCLVLAEAPP